MQNTPEWLSLLETLTFITVVGTIAYNRAVSWKKFNERTSKLEISFQQYQTDIERFFRTCETCRTEVARHHENIERHVNLDMRTQIKTMAEEISEIKAYLMQNK